MKGIEMKDWIIYQEITDQIDLFLQDLVEICSFFQNWLCFSYQLSGVNYYKKAYESDYCNILLWKSSQEQSFRGSGGLVGPYVSVGPEGVIFINIFFFLFHLFF